GSQRQVKSRTVQGELEKALRKLGWTGRSVILAGRTDSGVHATGQVASVDLDWSHTETDLVRTLNATLPADMSVKEARVVHAEFHPRFDAQSRRYRYRLFCQSIRNPIRERFAWRVWPAVEADILANAARLFHGSHDFSAFGSPTSPKGGTMRTVMKAEWMQAEQDEWYFEVQADAFLYRMVRRLVFVQVAVAQGKFSNDVIVRSLAQQARAESRSEIPAGLAPAHGLTLVEVMYPHVESMGQ
ncbi:MAG: tRNA pseudouridine(38-40) synthase TruA, partial [Anaerolineales bacterium]